MELEADASRGAAREAPGCPEQAHRPPASQAGGALAFQGALVVLSALSRQRAGHPLDATFGGR